MGFTSGHLDLIDDTREVWIETKGDAGSHRTVVWVVVDDGEVFIRSVRGRSGKWYQRVLANPEVTLEVARAQIPARAHPAADADTVERVDRALRRKYPPSQSLDAMLHQKTLETTLRLEPA